MTAGSLTTIDLIARGGAVWYNNVAAQWRQFLIMFRDLNTGCGLVQTSDTGQVDTATALVPTFSASTKASPAQYMVFRFADSLQATRPIFVKFVFGTGASSGAPGVWMQIGTGTDGAGTLTGVVGGTHMISTERNLVAATTGANTNSATTGTAYSYSFGLADGTGFWVALLPSQYGAVGNVFFYIERTRNFDGTANGDGYIYGTVHKTQFASVFCYQHAYDNNSGSTPMVGGGTSSAFALPSVGGSVAPAPWSTFVIGTTLYPLPVLTGLFPRMQGPSQLFLLCQRQDYPSLSQLAISHYGTSRQFLHMGLADIGYNNGWGYGSAQGADSFLARCSG